MLSLETQELGKASIPFLLYPASLLATNETINRVEDNGFSGDLYYLTGVMITGGPLTVYNPIRLRFSKPFFIRQFTALVFQLKLKANASETARRMRISVAAQNTRSYFEYGYLSWELTDFTDFMYNGDEAIRQTKILGGVDYWSIGAGTEIDLNLDILKLLDWIDYEDDDLINVFISFDGAPLQWDYVEKCNVLGSGEVPEGFYA